VRGEPGTDREHVVVRDSDPRIGEHSLFDVPVASWVGQELEVATMTSSTILAVTAERDPVAIAAVGVDGKLDRNPWARPDAASRRTSGLVRTAAAGNARIAADRRGGRGERTPRPPQPRLRSTARREAGRDGAGAAARSIGGRPSIPAAPRALCRERGRAAARSPGASGCSRRRRRCASGCRSFDDAVVLLEQIRRRDRK
jgi:hypothetical protein